MADIKKKVIGSVSGEFFVDTTCINCDTCRQLAPDYFDDNGDYSYVSSQPASENGRIEAARALLACPTGSIGNNSKSNKSVTRRAMDGFPLVIDPPVYYNGFNSPKSYGGNSFLIVRTTGNWLVDSPRFNKFLVEQIEKLGGLSHIFLTHEDDVADADRYSRHFSAERIIHRQSLSACPDAEVVIDDFEALAMADDLMLIPTPGHTLGHMVLLFKNKFLFTGDHLYFDRHKQKLSAHRRHCWYSWEEQIVSMERLLDYDFEWVLAGHGDRSRLSIEESKNQLKELIDEMRT